MTTRPRWCPDCGVLTGYQGERADTGDHLGNCPSGPLYAPGQGNLHPDTTRPGEPRFYVSRGGCWNMDPHEAHGECPGMAA